MDETKDDINEKKIKEAKFVIFSPFFITFICVWLDILFQKDKSSILDITKLIYTYFFPSIISEMIILIIQKSVYNSESCTIADGKTALSTIFTALYGVLFISCLFTWGKWASIIFGIFSFIYIAIIWFFCLDKNITHNISLKEEERKALRKYSKKN